MSRLSGRRALAVGGAAVILVLGLDSITYATTGTSLILGKANKAGAVTTVQNTGKGSALNLVTKSATTAPLTTNAKGLVKNFYAARAANADKVGGLTVAQITTAAKGATGAAGPAGPTGATGPAGPLLATLGTGQTETGAYGLEVGSPTSGSAYGTVISYPFPVGVSPTVVFVPAGGPNPDPTHCTGSMTAPAASSGYLCVYEGYKSPSAGAPAVYGMNALSNGPKTHGTLLQFVASSTATVVDTGSWALTG